MPAPAFVAPTKEPHTYTGTCRCKANKFTIELPELTSGMTCNCSICSVHDLFWTFPDHSVVKFEREGEYIDYEWNSKQYVFNFCATCGNLVKGSMKSTGGLAINLRMLQDVDIWALRRDPEFDGAALPPPYKSAEFTGPAFTTSDDAGDSKKTEVYYGSCHCGACQIAVRSQPLHEIDCNECNCALCWKDARIHIYPPSASDVHLGGVENLKMFITDPKTGGGSFFCKTCGVALFDAELEGGAVDGDGKKIPSAKEKLGHDLHVYAVNVRALRGVDWNQLKPNRYDGRNIDPQFVAD